jgi:hypothetical protein
MYPYIPKGKDEKRGKRRLAAPKSDEGGGFEAVFGQTGGKVGLRDGN